MSSTPRPEVPIRMPPRRRRRLWPWFLGVTIGLLVIGLVVGWILVGNSVDARLNAAIAEANRDDPNWQINDLMEHREKVADADNGAIVVARVVAKLPQSWPSATLPPGQMTAPRSPLEDAFERYYKLDGNVRLDDADADLIREELAKYPEQVQLARTIARFKKGRHELTLGPTIIDTLLPETQSARNAARLLQADAAIRAHDGDLDGAIESCRAILGVGRSIGDEPFLISGLVRIAIGTVCTSTARRVLGQGQVSDEVLAKLQADLEAERKQPLLYNAMRGERAGLTEIIRRIGDGEMPIDALSGSAPSNPGQPIRRTTMTPWGRLLFRNQRAVAIEWMNQAVAISKQPASQQGVLFNNLEDEIKRVKLSKFGPYLATMPLLLIPAISAVPKAQVRYEAELGATILLIAAERQRRQTGKWPENLESIDKAILPETLLDPNGGKAYRFKYAEGRLTIYSLGSNLRDEGGLYEPRKAGGGDDVGTIGWDLDQRNRKTP